MFSRIRPLFAALAFVLPTASIPLDAQSIHPRDFETAGQFTASFRPLLTVGSGTAGQITVASNGLFRLDSTGGSQVGIYLFDQTPYDATPSTDSGFVLAAGDILTVAFDARTSVNGSSFSILFINPANYADNLLAILNINGGGTVDQIRFFRDVNTPNAALGGTQTGGGNFNVGVDGGATNFVRLTVTLSFSGTTPTLSATCGTQTTPVVSTFSSGDFTWNTRTLVGLRLYDNSTGASSVDIDNVSITSPSAPDNPPPAPEPNFAPTLPAQADRSIAALDTLVVTNTGTDTNTPPQTLSYQLTAAPAGAAISPSGIITWTPTPDNVSENPYTFTILVTDSGEPALTATNTFNVTVTAAPVFDYSESLPFTTPADFTDRFRVLTAFGGGTLGVVDGALTADARSNGGNTSAVLLYDPVSRDPATAPQTTFPSSQQVRVSFLARAAVSGSSFSVSFADPKNASNRVSASLILNTGADTLRFFRDGSITSTSSSAGTQVGPDAFFDAGSDPGDGASVPVTVILTVNGTTPTLTVLVGANSPVTSAFVAGDFDWTRSAVLLRFGDPTANTGPIILDDLLVAGGTPVAAPAPTLPPAPTPGGNLITVNPGFESGSLNNFSGSYAFTGWTGTNALFSFHGFNSGTAAAGTVTQGTRALRQSWGGTLITATTARPVATPGMTYELTYDQRSLIRNFPNEKLGTTPHLEFFDAAGVRIKQVWPTTGPYRVQTSGTNTWETFTLRAVAPPGAARVGLFFNNPAGRFASNEENYTQDRHVEMDNIRLTVVPDTIDRIAYRRLARLVEPGKTATLKLHHLALAPRTLRAALLDASGTERASASLLVPAGRFRATPLSVAIPADLPDGAYAWRIQLLATDSSAAVATLTRPGVITDQSVTPSPLNTTDFPANHPRIQWQGRIEDSGASRIWHWHGSEVRVRFSGTSLTLVGGVVANIYGLFETHTLVAVVNENFAAPINLTFAANGSTQTLPVVTGLPDGMHTVRLYKNLETDRRLRFDRFRVDSGRGLLAYEPLPSRRIEAFGDSVSNASSATPAYNGFTHLIGRELDADFRNIAKGGAGIASSFVGVRALISNFYNNLTYENVFEPSQGVKYDLSQWTPHLVLFGFGHNDQFNGGGGTPFNNKYAEIKTNIRAAYPGVAVLSANTTIANSNNYGHFNNAIAPLLADDPRHVFVYQPNTWSDSGTIHPPTDAHLAMAFGDERHASLIEAAEDLAGWGLDAPATGYEDWAASAFTPAERAAGLHAPEAAPASDGIPNLLRYALGATATSAVTLPIAATTPDGKLTLTFPRAEDDALYVIETSTDLVTWHQAAINPGTVGETVVWTDAQPASPRRFARLRIVHP